MWVFYFNNIIKTKKNLKQAINLMFKWSLQKANKTTLDCQTLKQSQSNSLGGGAWGYAILFVLLLSKKKGK